MPTILAITASILLHPDIDFVLLLPVLPSDVFFADDYDPDDLVDVIEGRCIYVPAIYVVNKIDQVGFGAGQAPS